MRLWSTQDGTCLRSFEGHTASILKICYVSLGTQLISAGADGLLKIWGVRDAGASRALTPLASPSPFSFFIRGNTFENQKIVRRSA